MKKRKRKSTKLHQKPEPERPRLQQEMVKALEKEFLRPPPPPLVDAKAVVPLEFKDDDAYVRFLGLQACKMRAEPPARMTPDPRRERLNFNRGGRRKKR